MGPPLCTVKDIRSANMSNRAPSERNIQRLPRQGFAICSTKASSPDLAGAMHLQHHLRMRECKQVLIVLAMQRVLPCALAAAAYLEEADRGQMEPER